MASQQHPESRSQSMMEQIRIWNTLFNVVENGQPRWAGVEKQYVDEASSASLYLLPYLSDTDDNGNPASAQDLSLELLTIATQTYWTSH